MWKWILESNCSNFQRADCLQELPLQAILPDQHSLYVEEGKVKGNLAKCYPKVKGGEFPRLSTGGRGDEGKGTRGAQTLPCMRVCIPQGRDHREASYMAPWEHHVMFLLWPLSLPVYLEFERKQSPLGAERSHRHEALKQN